MIWQDYVLTAGAWVFIFALLPSIYGDDKPAISTSLMTGSVLAIFAFTYWTLDIVVASVSTALTALTWFLLAFQVYQRSKKENIKTGK